MRRSVGRRARVAARAYGLLAVQSEAACWFPVLSPAATVLPRLSASVGLCSHLSCPSLCAARRDFPYTRHSVRGGVLALLALVWRMASAAP